jgi:DUF4097 and DUF4098 domain-containing protein YvlB
MTTWEYPCSDPVEVQVEPWASGSIAVSGEPTDTVSVEVVARRPSPDTDQLIASVKVTFADGKLTIVGPQENRRLAIFWRRGIDLTIKIPEGSDLVVRAAAADISCVGRLGEVDLRTASGDVTVATATGGVTANSASGDISISEAGADVAVRSTSGDVRIGRAAGVVNARTVSGDFSIAGCGGSLTANTISGDVQARDLVGGQVELTTVSGDVYASVTTGIALYLDLATTTGDVRSDLDEGAGDDAGAPQDVALEIKCRSVSGDIRIARGAVGTSTQHPASA